MMIQVPVILYDTATTEIYTDLHTLALHAALPIHAVAFEIDSGTSRALPWPKSARPLPSPTTTNAAKPKRLPPLTVLLTRLIWTSFSIMSSPCSSSRSDEHTSELKLLMRISYAVFLLKKKHTLLTHNLLR